MWKTPSGEFVPSESVEKIGKGGRKSYETTLNEILELIPENQDAERAKIISIKDEVTSAIRNKRGQNLELLRKQIDGVTNQEAKQALEEFYKNLPIPKTGPPKAPKKPSQLTIEQLAARQQIQEEVKKE